MASIFISYRRGDAGSAGRLRDSLKAVAEYDVFFDVNSIPPGADFPKTIRNDVVHADVVLVVIGAQWVNEVNLRRLGEVSDWVRIEIELGLQEQRYVIPVLLDGVKPPSASDLPESLRALATRNAFSLSHEKWESDAALLKQALDKILSASIEEIHSRPAVPHYLPYLCDRIDQEDDLLELLEDGLSGLTPVLIVHGHKWEDHSGLLERFRYQDALVRYLGTRGGASLAPSTAADDSHGQSGFTCFPLEWSLTLAAQGQYEDGKHGAARRMPQLLVKPKGHDASPAVSGNAAAPGHEARPGVFKPKFSNWQRRAKVPVLLLNAASLNSGHNWQFTARWMGEPPGLFETDADIDANVRYRRLYYEQAPTQALRVYRLGHAVAASACVPGIFEPLVLPGLYPGRTVRLVDGGVHDNQGVAGLLDEGCTLVLCSDACGQMEDMERPSDTFIGVPLRANSILQDRIREAEYQDLRARVENRALQGLFFVHLKKGLSSAPLDWTDCKDPTPLPDTFQATTPFGVDRDIQRRLAAIRTDLDAFTEVEAYALMASGYLMTTHEFRALQCEYELGDPNGTWGDFDIDAARRRWPFLRLADLMRQPADSPDCRRRDLGLQLETGSGLFFKVWRLVPQLRALAVGGAAALAILAVWFITTYWDTQVPWPQWHASLGTAVIAAGSLVAATVFPIVKWMNPHGAVRGYATKAAVAVAGWIAGNVHVRIFDPIYLKRGRLRRLLRLE